jgi:hypothetical protein
LSAADDVKPRKTDIDQIEFAWCDADPRADETPSQAKQRYQAALEKAGLQAAMVDSGNGLQAIFKLQTKIPLGEPIQDGVDEKGKPKLVFLPVDQDKIDEVESRIEGLTLMLGAPGGTQNIDRILRLPGTTNHPNKKKLGEGRTQCKALLMGPLEVPAYPLGRFPKASEPEPEPSAESDFNTADDDQEFAGGYDDDQDGNDDELQRTIKDGGGNRHGKSRSESVFYVACELVRRGKTDDEIADILCDLANGISESVRETKNPRETAKRQAARARKKVAASKRRNVDSGDPLKIARALVAAEYTEDGKQTLWRHRGTFWHWIGTHYEQVDEAIYGL